MNYSEEDFSTLALLPPEILEKICYEMDNQTLGMFVQSQKRVLNVCDKALKQKELHYGYTTDQFINNFIQKQTVSLLFEKEETHEKFRISKDGYLLKFSITTMIPEFWIKELKKFTVDNIINSINIGKFYNLTLKFDSYYANKMEVIKQIFQTLSNMGFILKS